MLKSDMAKIITQRGVLEPPCPLALPFYVWLALLLLPDHLILAEWKKEEGGGRCPSEI